MNPSTESGLPDANAAERSSPESPLGTPPPDPSFTQTFCWVDGEYEEYAWMTSDDSFTEDITWQHEPREMLVETWERTAAEVRMLYPDLVSCAYGDDDHDDDAVAWQQENTTDGLRWMQTCEQHRHATTTRVGQDFGGDR